MIVGVDFGAPRAARDQRRKLVALAAIPQGRHAYRIDVAGFNARVVGAGPPGWSAAELAAALIARPARVVGFDFPFGVPAALLDDPGFAGGPRFATWRAFHAHVARHLPLRDPLDFAPFAAWRDPAARARLWSRRATDVAAAAQPPLKDRFQATFQMTLLGNALLARLRASGHYRVRPFPGERGAGELVEVYPGATLRACGLAHYKARPAAAVRAAIARCAAAGIALAIDRRVLARARTYSSGTAAAPDHDVADAVVALCTAILYAEGHAVAALPPATPRATVAREGAIWVPRVTA